MSCNFILIQMVLTPSPTGQERKQTGRAPPITSLQARMDRGPEAAPRVRPARSSAGSERAIAAPGGPAH